MAMDLEDTLARAGAVVVSLCRTLEAAIAHANVDDFAVAVLDFGLGPDTASHVAPAGPPGRPVHSPHREVERRPGLGRMGLSKLSRSRARRSHWSAPAGPLFRVDHWRTDARPR